MLTKKQVRDQATAIEKQGREPVILLGRNALYQILHDAGVQNPYAVRSINYYEGIRVIMNHVFHDKMEVVIKCNQT